MGEFEMILLIIMFLGITLTIISLMFKIRNNKVYNVRMKLIKKDIKKYNQLPNYDIMLFKFWKSPQSFVDELEEKI